MNTDKQPSNPLAKNLLIVVATIVITAAIEPWACKKIKYAAMTQQERIEAEYPPQPGPKDSVQMAYQRITKDDFYSNYTGESWFAKYQGNSMAFDDSYKNKLLDVFAEVYGVEENYGCPKLILKVGDNALETIEAYNCSKSDKRAWKETLMYLEANKWVHVRGKYDASASNKLTLVLDDCSIIDDPSYFDEKAN